MVKEIRKKFRIKIPTYVKTLLSKNKRGIKLDCGCGLNKQKGFIGMDKRKIPGVVDIIHDIEVFPFPLPDNTCSVILMSHVIEHIKPWLMIDLMNELWRVMEPGGQLWLAFPYAGSFGFWQDPTHCNGCNQATFTYFDPKHPLYQVYKPLPWDLKQNTWSETGNMEVILEKVLETTLEKKKKGAK